MSTMISVREDAATDTTVLWFHEDGQTLGIRSLPTSEAWTSVEDPQMGAQWFQTLALVDMARDMVAEYYECRTMMEWLGKGWRITRF
jgi:hypothetical protein